jgi:hypothetical protein
MSREEYVLMKAQDVQDYLRSLNGGWVNVEKTVDQFKTGDPNAEVRGVAVGWMGYTWALRKALELGCNVFVTHEPTFYDNYKDDAKEGIPDMPGARAKWQFVQDSGLVIIRCHDLWDQMPGIGIPASWGEWLGLGQPIAGGDGIFRVYDAGGRTARDVARQVAAKTKAFGQDVVELAGPADRPVNRICIGTGAITPFWRMLKEYDADMAICADDGIWYWRDGGYAIDNDIPLLVVHHHVAEEAGLMNLAKRLMSAFPAVPVHHIPERCMYTTIRAEA